MGSDGKMVFKHGIDGKMELKHSMFETSHVLGAVLASSTLLTQAWAVCDRANAGGSPFVVHRCEDAIYVAFARAPQAVSGLSGGFFDPVPIYGSAHELFAPLASGEADGDGQPVLVQAGALQLFLTLYHSPDFQLLASETRNKEVILTGHSVGGCLASLVALHFLCSTSRPNSPSPSSLLCITFGSPLIGNKALSRAILRERWGGRFCHVVAQYDVVPRLFFCPLNAAPPQFTAFIRHLFPYPQFSISASELSDDQKAELHKYISKHTGEAAAVAAEQKQRVNSYTPFGNYALCSAEGAVCIDDPLTVVKMLHLTFAAADASGWIEQQHVAYGDLVSSILEKLQMKKRPRDEEEGVESNYGAGVSLALEASGIGLQDMAAARESLALSMCERPKLTSASLAIKLAKVTPCRAQIEWYKELYDGDMGYYDCFKHRKVSKRDAKVNMNRIKLGQFWDELLDMLQQNKLPHDLLKRDKWVNAAQFYKLLVEPLDIAEYYRCQLHKGRGHYMSHGRERRYEVFDKWWDNDKDDGQDKVARKRRKFAGLTQDSCFWAKLEEARECVKNAWTESNPAKLVELWENINGFESYASGLVERKEVSEDVLAPRSSYSLWVAELKQLKLARARCLPSSSVLVGVTGGM